MDTIGKIQRTPGPWTMYRIGDHFVIQPMANPGAIPIAVTKMDQREGADCEANARLIAAAPLMLEGLKEALEYIRALYQKAYGQGLPSNNSVANQLRVALERAEGEDCPTPPKRSYRTAGGL